MNAEPLALGAAALFGVAHSFTGRRWVLSSVDEAGARILMRDSDVSPVLARLLTARGVKASEIFDYLHPTLRRLLPEPLGLKDMDKAVARCVTAIKAGQRIAVWGDYDVDGSTSAALLYEYLAAIGHTPRIYIPDRLLEGYGPNEAGLLKLKTEGVSLVITVDCGASAITALSCARDAGLDVIVLDHHAVENAPPAEAHVNPNEPGDTSGLGHVCAAGIAFLFVVALNRALREWLVENAIAEPSLMELTDYVGLATICDVVPLTGLNRAFVRAGLFKLSKLDRPGFAALASICAVQPPFTPYHAGFILGPRINAGGRVGNSALGVELLIERDATIALEQARQLDIHNRERQTIEKLILEEAITMASLQHNAQFLLLSKQDWHPGVVGIVAGRLKDRFNKPSFVVGFEGGLGRGSARSIPGVDIGAIVRAARDKRLIDNGGGHAMAAGFSLSPRQLEPFGAFVAARLAQDAQQLQSPLELDAIVAPVAASAELVDEIANAGPFGAGNTEPLIVTPDVEVLFVDIVGRDHIRLKLKGGDGARLDAIAFRAAGTALGAGLISARGRKIHAVGRLRAQEWNGKRRVQLQLEDATFADI